MTLSEGCLCRASHRPVVLCAATSGGAGYCAGDVFPGAGSLVIQDSIFTGNNAELGGSLYATTGAPPAKNAVCRMSRISSAAPQLKRMQAADSASAAASTGCIAIISTTTFSGNTAQQYGSAILTTASVSLAITTCSFDGNGNVAGAAPPQGGGAISIGYNQFIVGGSPPVTFPVSTPRQPELAEHWQSFSRCCVVPAPDSSCKAPRASLPLIWEGRNSRCSSGLLHTESVVTGSVTGLDLLWRRCKQQPD